MKLDARIWGLVLVVGLVVGCGGRVWAQGATTPTPTVTVTPAPTMTPTAMPTATAVPPTAPAPTPTATLAVLTVKVEPADSSAPSTGVTLLYVIFGGALIVGALWAIRIFLNVKETTTTRRRVGLVIAIECLVMVGCYLLVQPIGKTLWEWMELLIVPILLAFGGLWFNQQRAQAEHQITLNRQRGTALQAYLDRMANLLDEKELQISEVDDEVRSIARTWTLAVLQEMDGVRKGLVIRFLYDAVLISWDIDIIVSLVRADLSKADLIKASLIRADLSETNLSGADLSDADLRGANLSGADLSGANLSDADLRGANLRGAAIDDTTKIAEKWRRVWEIVTHNAEGWKLSKADLSEAYLSGANLSGANLSGANLSETDLSETDLSGVGLSGAHLRRANLRGANLRGAYLHGANLHGANLRGTNLRGTNLREANLRGANLHGAKTITNKQLSQAKSLEGTILPNGLVHRGPPSTLLPPAPQSHHTTTPTPPSDQTPAVGDGDEDDQLPGDGEQGSKDGGGQPVAD